MKRPIDLIRRVRRWLDGRFVELIGREVTIYTVLENPLVRTEPVLKTYGIYERVQNNYMKTFGVDSPDEVSFLFDAETVQPYIKINTKLVDEAGTEYLVVNYDILDDAFWGKGRLQVDARLFMVSQTSGLECEEIPAHIQEKVERILKERNF